MRYLLLLIPSLFSLVSLYASPVLVAGDDRSFLRKLNASFDVIHIEKGEEIDIDAGRTLILTGRETLPAAYRIPIDRFLRAGGNLIVLGGETLNYEPRTGESRSLHAFDTLPRIVRPKRTRPGGSTDTPTVTLIEHEGMKGIAFSTSRRGMQNTMFEIPLRGLSPEDNTIVFDAQGSHFMDLLPIEITDRAGTVWYTFVPLDTSWHRYSVSLADFLPEGWDDPDTPYPLLQPAQAATLRMGMNTMALWHEKAMSFAVAGLGIAHHAGDYTPSSRLKRLRLPFEQIGITAPAWIVDPFSGGEVLQNTTLHTAGNCFSPNISEIGVSHARLTPPLYYEHPGSAMGSDHKKSLRDKLTRMMRTETFLTDRQGNSAGTFVQYGRGRYAGGSVTLIGFGSGHPQATEIVVPLIRRIEGIPRIAGFSMTTTSIRERGRVCPVILTEIVNPLDRATAATLSVDLGGRLSKELKVTLAPFSCRQYSLELPEVPENFPMTRFDWKITCSTSAGDDSVTDRTDVERALITALRHLVRTQRLYPDGRISNHYFGDAYGVRAMFAYTDLLRREPDRIKRHADLWETVSPEEIRHCGERFFTMLADSQLPSGAWPMGYSEHARVYNVADCGQMGLAIGQSLRYVTDTALRTRYLSSMKKFGEWAETYYIDSARSERLRHEKPEEFAKGDARPGFYGLGPSGRRDRPTGPSWVLSDILGAQILLARLTAGEEQKRFRRIADRNSDFYVRNRFSAASYFQAEALCWIYLDTRSEELKSVCRETLDATFLPGLYQGKELEMYGMGGRATLKALPLLYCMELFGDDAAMRAVLLKYIWSFASPSYVHSMEHLSKNMPRPVHGESIGTAKYAALSALWAMELLEPGSTLAEDLLMQRQK